MESHDALERGYMKDIFSAFMWTVARAAKGPLDNHADLQTTGEHANNLDRWKYSTLQSSRLSKLARDIHDTGLQSLHHVYLSIIPPLSAYNQLPRLDAVIQQACEQGQREERRMMLSQASQVYGSLLHVASRYSSESFVYRNALAIAIQYLEARNSRRALDHFIHSDVIHDDGERFERFLKRNEEPLRRVLLAQKERFRPRMLHSLRRPRAILHRAAIHSLVRGGEFWRVRHALRDGASPGVTDFRDLTPLHYACQNGDRKMVELLLEYPVSVDAQSVDGSSPLHLAALNGHEEVVDMLRRRNASTSPRDNYGRLPIHCAAMNGHQYFVEMFIADAKAPDNIDRTALHYAAWFGQTSVVETLLEPRRNFELEDVDVDVITPLHLAATRGHGPGCGMPPHRWRQCQRKMPPMDVDAPPPGSRRSS